MIYQYSTMLLRACGTSLRAMIVGTLDQTQQSSLCTATRTVVVAAWLMLCVVVTFSS